MADEVQCPEVASMSIHQLWSRFQDYTHKMNDVALVQTMEQTYL